MSGETRSVESAAQAVPPSAPAQGMGLEEAGPDTAQAAAPLGTDATAWFLASLLDRTTHPFALVTFDGRFVRVNRAFAGLVGYTVDELLHLNLRDITPPHWIQATAGPLARLRATGLTERYEKVYLRKDGSLVPVDVVVDLYRDERDVPQGYFAFVTDITERKRAERALRESEERFRRLYDEAPVGYHEIDAEGTILNVNRTECELLGFRREEMLGRSIFDFVAAEVREEARRAVREKLSGARPLRPFERAFTRRDGRRIVIEIEDRLKYDDGGRPIGLLSTLQDITARKQTEAALVASERRSRALFEGIEDAVFVHDLQGRILDANPAASRRLGYSHEELLQLTTRDIDEPDFARGFTDRLEEQLRRGSLSFEGRHRAKDGRVIPVDINTSLIQFEDQRAILAVMRDITERNALEEARRQLDEARLRTAQEIEAKNRELTVSESRYRQLTEGCLDAVVVADPRGLITLFNPAAERTFGYEAREVLGQPIQVLMPERFHGLHAHGFERYLATRDPRVVGRTVELCGRRKTGEEFPLELSLSAADVAGELQFIGSIRDQTERQRMRDMLMQSEKLASIGLLSAGVAHEINNPLAYVGNNLAVLERDVKGLIAMLETYESSHDRLKPVAAEMLAKVQVLSDEIDWPYVHSNLGRMLTRTREGVQRVANIVHNLRGLARTSPPRMEEAMLPDLVASAFEMVQSRARRSRIEVQIDCAPVPKVRCVASQISQVMLNLILNAIQAIEELNRPGGGLIQISVRRRGADQVIEIRDNGCGIEPENFPKLFDPFFTTKPVGEGTGLGLSISHGIVTGHGGRIEIESQRGQGSCFRIILPQTPPESMAQLS